ncbi:hypothetical protein F1654_07155 [Alkalicaulis satelles]|uniref:Ryanodine receptor Ryr domain-containing protein n=1 Tax=Alkalicaulis satelles TaxID=2609175 RepID=A0A5M6ZIC8_9PROT|nr:RyR domain-containing protein [Alkalicaulis satelles]KAA5803574.1 hypothetical protein F1654_07155 [Alkalicaulis satelles]
MFQFRKAGIFLLIAALAVGGIFVAGWSAWFEHLSGNETVYGEGNVPPQWQIALDAAHSALRAFAVGDEYARLFAASSDGQPPGDWRLEIARFGGIAVFYIAIIFGLLALLSEPLNQIRARLRRGHLAILGETETARNLAEMWLQFSAHHRFARRGVTYHTSTTQSLPGKVLVQPRTKQLSKGAIQESLKGANRIVVAEAHDGMTIESALEIARRVPETPVFAVLSDPWLAQRIRHGLQSGDPDPSGHKERTSKGDLLTAVSLSSSAARSLLQRHPPFAIAMKNSHPRIHALVVGLDGLGEAIILDILNSNLVTQLETPAVTVIDIAAGKRVESFKARHPGLVEHFDFFAIEADVTSLNETCITALEERCRLLPVTATYVATSDTGPALKGAIAIREAALREELFDTPVFLRASEGAGLPQREGGVAFEADCELVSFGTWKEIMHASGILEPVPDRLARDYHAAYLKSETQGQPAADIPWESLDEQSRISNRRAVDHIPAKLASLGFDLDGYLRGQTLTSYSLPAIASHEVLFRNATELVNLARLEHERWMFDRWMNGWRYGVPRNNSAFIHDNLVPFDELDDRFKTFDIRLVYWLSSHIRKTRDGLVRLPDASKPPQEREADVKLVERLFGRGAVPA